MKNKISIIVPIYNVEKYISRCLESLVKQTYSDIEVIMVDDCSSDSSARIAAEYAEKDSRFKYVRRTTNGMLSAARNTGLCHITGDWITFVDSDDWVDQNYCKKMVEAATRNGADIVACKYVHIWDSGKTERIDPFNGLTSQSTHKEKVALMRNHACTRLYRRTFWDSCGLQFPEGIKRCAEMGITIPLLSYTDKIELLDEYLYFYYQRENSNSLSNTKGLDLSYWNQVIGVMEKNICPGFESEMEAHEIIELVYGRTIIGIKTGYSNEQLKRWVDEIYGRYPHWRRNIYIRKFPAGKQLVIILAGLYQFWLIRLLNNLRDYARR